MISFDKKFPLDLNLSRKNQSGVLSYQTKVWPLKGILFCHKNQHVSSTKRWFTFNLRVWKWSLSLSVCWNSIWFKRFGRTSSWNRIQIINLWHLITKPWIKAIFLICIIIIIVGIIYTKKIIVEIHIKNKDLWPKFIF